MDKAPVLVPGTAFTQAQRDHFASLQGSSLAKYSRPEYTNIGSNIAPTGHWLAPSVTDTAFFSDITVKATSFAASADGIRNGVKIARAWVEGASLDIPAGSVSIPLDASRGGVRPVPGYQFTLPWAGIADGRRLEMYWEFIPTDAMAALGMQARVIGPMFVTRKTNYDITAMIDRTIATNDALVAGGTKLRFKSEGALLNALAAQSGTDGVLSDSYVHVTYATDGASQSSDVAQWGGANRIAASNARTARVTFDGGGTVTLANTASPDAYVLFRPLFSGLDFVDFKIDVGRIGNMCGSGGERVLSRLIGSEVYSDGAQEVDVLTGVDRSAVFDKGSVLAFERVYLHDLMVGDNGTSVQIGCKILRSGHDVHNMGYPVPFTIVATDDEYHGSPIYGDPPALLTLAYSGPGSPSYGISGAWSTASRTLTLYVDNVPVPGGTFQASVTRGADGIYTMVDLMNAINAFGGGWSCRKALNFDDLAHYRFANLGYPMQGNRTQPSRAANGFVDIRATTNFGQTLDLSLGVRTANPLHADWMQPVGPQNFDNNLFLCSTSVQGLHQLVFLGNGSIPGYTTANTAIILCALNCNADYVGFADFVGQIASDQRHLMVVGITMPTGRFVLRVDGRAPGSYDQFTRIMNIYARDFGIGTLTPTNFKGQIKAVVTSRRTTALPVNVPGIDTSTILSLGIGSGSQPTVFDTGNFPDIHGLYAQGPTPSRFTIASFRPVGRLRTAPFLVQKQLDQDLFGNPTAALDMVGAVALAA